MNTERPSGRNLSAEFEQAVLQHMDAAYNLARWLTGSELDAQDVVQTAMLRAFQAFDRFRGGNARAWLLTIVRNSSYTWLKKNRATTLTTEFDEELHGAVAETPADILSRNLDREKLRAAIEALPAEFREAIVLRELEGMSYKEMADVAGVPLGTVMSRLARARAQLQKTLSESGEIAP
jgi:RNA polymerase sigma-70 factor, ECF subfamily